MRHSLNFITQFEFHSNEGLGLRMRSVPWNRFPINRFKPVSFLWRLVTWTQLRGSLNHCKKEDISRLIPRKLTASLELLIVETESLRRLPETWAGYFYWKAFFYTFGPSSQAFSRYMSRHPAKRVVEITFALLHSYLSLYRLDFEEHTEHSGKRPEPTSATILNQGLICERPKLGQTDQLKR